MSYGIEITNGANRKLISSTTPSYQIAEIGVLPYDLTIWSGYPDEYDAYEIFFRHHTVTVKQDFSPAALCFIRIQSVPDTSKKYTLVGSFFKAGDFSGHFQNTPAPFIVSAECMEFSSISSSYEISPAANISQPPVIEYCIVDVATEFTDPGEGRGLNIFDANGDLTFSSEFPCARIWHDDITSPVVQLGSTLGTATVYGTGLFYQGTLYGEVRNLWQCTSHNSLVMIDMDTNFSSSGTEMWEKQFYRHMYWDFVENQIGMAWSSTGPKRARDPDPDNYDSYFKIYDQHQTGNDMLGVII
jgi:hypothetical protein